jgi:hypothetical protein
VRHADDALYFGLWPLQGGSIDEHSWLAKIRKIYEPFINFKLDASSGAADRNKPVLWTNLYVRAKGGRVVVCQKAAYALSESELRLPTPARAIGLLRNAAHVIAMGHTIQIIDSGCHDERSFRVVAVFLLLAGHRARDIVGGVVAACRRRGLDDTAAIVADSWLRCTVYGPRPQQEGGGGGEDRVDVLQQHGWLLRWVHRIRNSESAFNCPAMRNRALHQARALVYRDCRTAWCAEENSYRNAFRL